MRGARRKLPEEMKGPMVFISFTLYRVRREFGVAEEIAGEELGVAEDVLWVVDGE